ASYQLPLDTVIRSLAFDGATGAVGVDTTLGPFASSDASSPAEALVNKPSSGESARLPDGTYVTPLLGTAVLAVTRAGATEEHPLAVPDGGTVLDVRSSPDGSALAVTVGVGPDELDRKDRIVVLDPTSLVTRGVIESDGPLEPTHWTVTNDGVVLVRG